AKGDINYPPPSTLHPPPFYLLPMPSATDYPRLRAFLRAQKPPAPASLAELRGFLFGVACAPVLLLPSQWLNPCLAYRGEPEFDSLAAASGGTREVMARYNAGVEGIRRERD